MPNQVAYVEYIKKSSTGLQDVPEVILQVAYQPTARGGFTHYTAGNVRITKFARELLVAQRRDEILHHDPWFIAHAQEVGDEESITENDWRRFMEDKHGMEEKNQGVEGHEQLLVLDQIIESCPLCKAGI
jgi:hypothetical protein